MFAQNPFSGPPYKVSQASRLSGTWSQPQPGRPEDKSSMQYSSDPFVAIDKTQNKMRVDRDDDEGMSDGALEYDEMMADFEDSKNANSDKDQPTDTMEVEEPVRNWPPIYSPRPAEALRNIANPLNRSKVSTPELIFTTPTRPRSSTIFNAPMRPQSALRDERMELSSPPPFRLPSPVMAPPPAPVGVKRKREKVVEEDTVQQMALSFNAEEMMACEKPERQIKKLKAKAPAREAPAREVVEDVDMDL